MDKILSVTNLPTCEGILFLQGVFKKDCKRMEDMFRDRLMNENITVEKKVYDHIPTHFTSIQKWPNSTNLLCWHCSRSFKSRPWFEPQSIEPISEGVVGKAETNIKVLVNRKTVSISVKGMFCTCNCVRAHIDLYTKDVIDHTNKISMLKFLYEIFSGKSVPDIQPSPPRTEMVTYGGELTEYEYQKKIDSLDMAYVKVLEDNNFSMICHTYLKTLTR